MSKFYAVKVYTTAVVQADDEIDALKVAMSQQRDICGDTDMELETAGEVRCIADLIEHGWDEQCLPYGGDGNTRLKDLLLTDGVPASPTLPEFKAWAAVHYPLGPGWNSATDLLLRRAWMDARSSSGK